MYSVLFLKESCFGGKNSKIEALTSKSAHSLNSMVCTTIPSWLMWQWNFMNANNINTVKREGSFYSLFLTCLLWELIKKISTCNTIHSCWTQNTFSCVLCLLWHSLNKTTHLLHECQKKLLLKVLRWSIFIIQWLVS